MTEPAHNQNPSDEEIAICAYLIWEHEGHPEKSDKAHWYQAEAQLIVCHAHDQWMSHHPHQIAVGRSARSRK